jgi:dipeptidase E
MPSFKIFLTVIFFSFFIPVGFICANQVQVVYFQTGDINVKNPETSQTFYDELKGSPRDYFITSSVDFDLYLNISVPEVANRDGRYSVDIYNDSGVKIFSTDGINQDWSQIYSSFERDYYLKGPEIFSHLTAGKYKVEVYSKDNQGKYILFIGSKESYDILSVLNIFWQFPVLKSQFFNTDIMQIFLTPVFITGIGFIGSVLILIALIFYLIEVVKQAIKHGQAKTLLLASTGSSMRDEIIDLLQKPAYDVMVGYITTAKNYQLEKGQEFSSRSLEMMKELGFNIELFDIKGKSEQEVMKFLGVMDIIFVGGGNPFYLLEAMRECNFEKVLRKLLKKGIVYIGSSAGSMVAGQTINMAQWEIPQDDSDKNIVSLKNLKGLNLVPFDVFVHYKPEYAEIIKKEIPNPKKRAKRLKILTDEQAILVQGTEVDLIGEGEAIVL